VILVDYFVDDDDDRRHGDRIIDDPLYEGSSISYKEMLVILNAFALRHKLTKEASADLIHVAQCLVPSEHRDCIPPSYYKLISSLNVDVECAVKHYYCQKCGDPVDNVNTACNECEFINTRDELEDRDSYFYQLDLKQVLKFALETPKNAEDLMKNIEKREQPNNDTLCDVVDGAAYKALGKRLQHLRFKEPYFQTMFLSGLRGFDLSCQLNSDGVKIFKSGIKELWPVFISLNEMSHKLRRQNILLVALWFGKKPKFTTYLRFLIEQCNELQESGLSWNYKNTVVHSRFRFPIFTADSMGRPSVQGFKQHNGYYGCPWCKAAGKRDKVSIYFGITSSIVKTYLQFAPNVHLYPRKCLKAKKRTDEEVREAVLLLDDVRSGDLKRDYTEGILFASPMLMMANFDMIKGFPLDYMHCVLLGVVRQITTLLWTSTRKDSFFVGIKGTEIPKVLLEKKGYSLLSCFM